MSQHSVTIKVFVEPSFGENALVVSTTTDNGHHVGWVIDPSFPPHVDRLLEYVRSANIRIEKIVLTHGCRHVEELAYRELITEHLPQHEYLGDDVRSKLVYYPTVTREKFDNNGRLTDLLRIGKLAADIGLPPVDPDTDRFMICGSPSMLKEICAWLNKRGFSESRHGRPAHYVIERAFVES